ncbi:hypothetical protein [Bacillus sp. JJ722]|uniref:hypothetical protein n=1 Tax=Bacillus sp. JJ722 TaxID=3122973 RepID=UPI002FFFF46B
MIRAPRVVFYSIHKSELQQFLIIDFICSSVVYYLVFKMNWSTLAAIIASSACPLLIKKYVRKYKA